MPLPAVGYQNIPVAGNNGVTWAVLTLQQMGKTLEKQTLASFQLPVHTEDQGFMSADSIVLEVYDETGTMTGNYAFVDNYTKGNFGLTNPGWYPWQKVSDWEVNDADIANNVEVPFGHGVVITSGEDDCDMTFAGQVLGEKTYTVFGNNGVTWIGNATPVDLKLGDLALPAHTENEGFMSADSIVLEIYDETGTMTGNYAFVDNYTIGNFGLTNPGWYPWQKVSDWEVTDNDLQNDIVNIPSGKMVIITSGEADTTLTLPDPMKVTPPTAE